MTPAELLGTTLIGSDGKPYPLSVFIVQTNATAYQASKQAAAATAAVGALSAAVTKLQATLDQLVATPVPVAQAQQVVDELGKRLNAPAA